jgi:aspartate/tyrosine/aromatic aminotransferase
LKDDFPDKVNVGVGAYRDDSGKPFVLPVVRDAEREINLENLDHEYSGIVSIGGIVGSAQQQQQQLQSLVCVCAYLMSFFQSPHSQAGCPSFVDHALKFVYGENSAPLKEKRIAGAQTLSGTGGLRVFGEVLNRFGHKHIYVPNPTWGNQ